LTQNTGEAEDLFQDTWFRVISYFDKISKVKNVKSWIYTITANLYRDLLRKKRIRRLFFFHKKECESKTDPSINTLKIHTDVYSNESDQTDLKMALKNAMEELPVRHRQVFILKEVEGFKHNEISKIMGIPEGTVKSLMHRTLKRLQELLSEFHPQSEKV
jgi:RNA polymerase sigma-70 factor (ECF subfamily)